MANKTRRTEFHGSSIGNKGILRLSLSLLASTSLIAYPAFAQDVLPTGGAVISGSAAIDMSGTAMTVTQTSDRAIVNWNGFSIGNGHSVNFSQPGTSSAILNRVTGAATSEIAGSLTGNGQVYLLNPNGIAITPNGTVKVGGGFVASTLAISNEDFLRGSLQFNGNGASAGVSNEGIISVGRGGYAALLGGTVRNDGLVAVPLGKVGIGSGERAALDLSGDGFMQVAVPTKAGAEKDGALIENSGKIIADGGVVVMQAATARDTARRAINLSGAVEARTVEGRDGAIILGGGEGGAVNVAGKVNATADKGRGGLVKITGKDIALKGAVVDASGAAGGGTVKVGGDWQGKAGTQKAERTSVDRRTTIRADAIEGGNGGTVVVWSDNTTAFDGLITARGAAGGAGGNAEVSGKAVLSYNGTADLSSKGGAFGNLLLDPYDVLITANAGNSSSGFIPNSNDSMISVDTLTAALSLANVEITTGSGGSQKGNITVASNITWSASTKLKLNAASGLYINGSITATGDGSGLDLQYDPWNSGMYLGQGATISLPGANSTLQIRSDAYTLVRSMADFSKIKRGKYALANDIDASGKIYTSAVVDTLTDNGDFNGLGHKIANLTINAPNDSNVGLFGSLRFGSISNVHLVNASITGSNNVGGIAGTVDTGSIISTSSFSGTVTGNDNVGGLIGMITNQGIASKSHTEGQVTGNNSVGGLVGSADGFVKLSNSTSTVTGRRGGQGTGGLVGKNNGEIAQAYATGSVTGDVGVGGLVGINDKEIWDKTKASIANSYAVGRVTGTSAVGGLVGKIGDTARSAPEKSAIYASYWDIDTTGTALGVGANATGFTQPTGLTTAQFQDTNAFYIRATAAGWNFLADWVPSSAGYYPELYLLSRVVTVKPDESNFSYGDNISNLTSSLYGKSWAQIFGTTDKSKWSLPQFTTTATSLSNVGKYDVSLVSGPSNYVTGTNQTYRVVYLPGSINIIPATLTVKADNGSMIYGDTTPTDLGYTVSGWKNGQTDSSLSGVMVKTSATSTSGVSRNYSTSASGGVLLGDAGGNYKLVYSNGTMAVTPRTITVTADDMSRTYGDANPLFSYTVGGAGLVNGDSLTGKLLVNANLSSAVGNYSIAQGTLANKNYAITYTAGNLVITPRAITVSANNLSRVYGDSNPQLTYSVSGAGLVNGDRLAGDLTTEANSTSGAGAYAISQGTLANGNYLITYLGGDLTVTPRAITIKANDASRIYGDANPALTYTATGLINGDLLEGNLETAANDLSGVGTYAISQGSLINGNYAITYVGGKLSVTPRALTVKANDVSRAYNQPNPLLTYTAIGLINGDTLFGTLATTAGAKSAAGNYAITQGTLGNENYDIAYVEGKLTVFGAATQVNPEPDRPLIGSFPITGVQSIATLIPTFTPALGGSVLPEPPGKSTSDNSEESAEAN